jgi:hypothetical protein
VNAIDTDDTFTRLSDRTGEALDPATPDQSDGVLTARVGTPAEAVSGTRSSR